MAAASSPASPHHLHPEESSNQGGSDGDNSNVREQDRFLPIANISRIMKKMIPAHAKISKDSKETVQESVSEFISFITDEANAKCQREKRKTINGDDILNAMSETGFDDYVELLTVYLHKYREIEEGKGSGMYLPGAQDSGNKEGGDLPMCPGVQMDLGGACGGGMAHMPPVSPGVQMGPGGVYDGGVPNIQPDSNRMQQMLYNTDNLEITDSRVARQGVGFPSRNE